MADRLRTDTSNIRDSTEVQNWRRWLHERPELGYDLPITSQFIAERLASFGCDHIQTEVATSGVVALVHGRAPGPVVALRADMDALPILETTSLPYASRHSGRMHACGHDGHVAMLLGAAKRLCIDRRFNGTVALIFQPAEEAGFGARAMIETGFLDRLGIVEIYGVHNWPGLPVGAFATREGALMAAVDTIEGGFVGTGGHAARPQDCRDPVIATAHFVMALQTLVTRETDARVPTVVSITQMCAGTTDNVTPDRSQISGTIRTLDHKRRPEIAMRVQAMSKYIAEFHRMESDISVLEEYPVLVNHAVPTQNAVRVARNVFEKVDADFQPTMLAEDFGAMLQVRPGAFAFLGNGDSAPLHAPNYDFNDELLPFGIAYLEAVSLGVLARLTGAEQ